MEYVFGIGILFVAILACFVLVKIKHAISDWFEARRVAKRKSERPPRLVCNCPGCNLDLYHDIQAVISRRSDATAFDDVVYTCDRCKTISTWIAIAKPPELRSFTKAEPPPAPQEPSDKVS
jgi:hypothetical protein